MSLTETAKDMSGDSPAAAGADHDAASANSHLAWMVMAARGQYANPYHYLLMLRFAVVNLVAFALLGVAHIHGFLEVIAAADQTRLVFVIFLAFLGGLVICAYKVMQTSRELNQAKEFNPMVPSRAAAYLAQIRGRSDEGRSLAASGLKLKLAHRIGVVRHVANSLVFMGLIGTVIGFIIALSGVDPSSVADVEAISPMVANLIEGISVALYTTLVGAVLHLWLMVNYRILANGTVNLITELIELGETNAGS